MNAKSNLAESTLTKSSINDVIWERIEVGIAHGD